MPSAPTRAPASMLEGVTAEAREGDAPADSESAREGAPLKVLQGGAEEGVVASDAEGDAPAESEAVGACVLEGVAVGVGGGLVVGEALLDAEFELVADGDAPSDSVAVHDAVGVEEAERVVEGVSDPVPVAEPEPVLVGVPLGVAVGERLPLSDTEAVMEGLTPKGSVEVGEGDTVVLPERVEEGVSDPVLVGVGVPVAVRVALGVGGAVALPLLDTVGVADGHAPLVRDAVGDGDGTEDGVSVFSGVGLPETLPVPAAPVPVIDGERLSDKPALKVVVELVVCVGETEVVGAFEPLAHAEDEPVTEFEGVGDGVPVDDAATPACEPIPELESVGLGVGLPDAVGDGLSLDDTVADGVRTGVGAPEPDTDGVALAAAPALYVEVDDAVGEGEEVGVNDGVHDREPDCDGVGVDAGVPDSDGLPEPEPDGVAEPPVDPVGGALAAAVADALADAPLLADAAAVVVAHDDGATVAEGAADALAAFDALAERLVVALVVVVMVQSWPARRTRRAPASTMKSAPPIGSMASPAGVTNVALVLLPSMEPAVPFPSTVVTAPLGAIMRTLRAPASETKMFPHASSATPTLALMLKAALVPSPSTLALRPLMLPAIVVTTLALRLSVSARTRCAAESAMMSRALAASSAKAVPPAAPVGAKVAPRAKPSSYGRASAAPVPARVETAAVAAENSRTVKVSATASTTGEALTSARPVIPKKAAESPAPSTEARDALPATVETSPLATSRRREVSPNHTPSAGSMATTMLLNKGAEVPTNAVAIKPSTTPHVPVPASVPTDVFGQITRMAQ